MLIHSNMDLNQLAEIAELRTYDKKVLRFVRACLVDIWNGKDTEEIDTDEFFHKVIDAVIAYGSDHDF